MLARPVATPRASTRPRSGAILGGPLRGNRLRLPADARHWNGNPIRRGATVFENSTACAHFDRSLGRDVCPGSTPSPDRPFAGRLTPLVGDIRTAVPRLTPSAPRSPLCTSGSLVRAQGLPAKMAGPEDRPIRGRTLLTTLCERWLVSRLAAGEVLHGEFDPGSGRTLAACLTHASGATNRASARGKAANG